MSTVSNYRQKTRKKVTLSDGTEVWCRPLSVSDFLDLGDIPTVFLTTGNSEEVKKVDPKFYAALLRTVLLNCIVAPEDFRVVDKKPQDCKDGELAVSELTAPDAGVIVQAVVEMSGMTKEAAQAAKPFRAE